MMIMIAMQFKIRAKMDITDFFKTKKQTENEQMEEEKRKSN